jgi:hypothetical protein
MKKLCLLVCLLVNICFLWAENIDVVVMVDTSWSLWQPFDDIENYLINSMLDQILHKGDSFSLLQFSAKTKVEIRERIVNGDSKTYIKNKVLQLKAPLLVGKYTDLLGAINFLYNYVDSLPQKDQKLIILVTDGIHDPPPGSRNDKDYQVLMKEFMEKARLIKNKGWDVHILQIPEIDAKTGKVKEGARDKRADFLKEMARELDITIKKYSPEEKEKLLAQTTGLAQVIFPSDLGTRGRRFTVPFIIKNNGTQSTTVTLTGVRSGDTNLLDTPKVTAEVPPQAEITLNAPLVLAEELTPGAQRLPMTLVFDGDKRIIGSKGELVFTYVPGQAADITGFFLSYILPGLGILLGLAVIILLIVFIRRRPYERKFVKVVDQAGAYTPDSTPAPSAPSGQRVETAAATTVVSATPKAETAHQQKLKADYSHVSFPIEMVVELQKRHIGFRNIHTLHKNKPVSVGGGHSAFLIFLVPIPHHIAEIHFDGSRFIFTPLKLRFFPWLKRPLKDCLGKEISLVSEKGYEFTLSFYRYISPLKQLNALLRSIRENQTGE